VLIELPDDRSAWDKLPSSIGQFRKERRLGWADCFGSWIICAAPFGERFRSPDFGLTIYAAADTRLPLIRGAKRRLFLIPSQRIDGVELCGFSGRKIAKYDTRQKSAREGNDYRRNRENHAPACNRGSR
jgi:hypothetical protein